MVGRSFLYAGLYDLIPAGQSVPPAVTRRLMRELSELKKNPPEGIRVTTSDENMLDVTGIIQGPG